MRFSIAQIFPVVAIFALVVRSIDVHGWQPLTLAWIVILTALVVSTFQQVITLWQGSEGLFLQRQNRTAQRTWLLIRLFGALIIFTSLIGVGSFPGLRQLEIFGDSGRVGWPQEILGFGVCFCLVPLWHETSAKFSGWARMLDVLVKGLATIVLGMFLLTVEAMSTQLTTISMFGIEGGFPLRWASGLRETAFEHLTRQREFAMQSLWGIAAVPLLVCSLWRLLVTSRQRMFWIIVWLIGIGLAVRFVFWVHVEGYSSQFVSDSGPIGLRMHTILDLVFYLLLGLVLALLFAPGTTSAPQSLQLRWLQPFRPRPWICWAIVWLNFFQLALWDSAKSLWVRLDLPGSNPLSPTFPFPAFGGGDLDNGWSRLGEYILDERAKMFGLAPLDPSSGFNFSDRDDMLGIIWTCAAVVLCLDSVRWWPVIRAKNWYLRTGFLLLGSGTFMVFTSAAIFGRIWPQTLIIASLVGIAIWSMFFLKRTPKPTMEADAVVEVVLRQSADGWLLPRAGLLAVTIGALWLTILWVMAATWPDNFWNEWLSSFGR